LRVKLKVQRSLRSDRVEQRKTQEKVFTSHLVEAETAKRVIEGGEEIPGSRLGARVAWSLYRKALPLYDRLSGRATYRGRFDGLSKRSDAIGIGLFRTRPRRRLTAARRIASGLNDRFGRPWANISTSSESFRKVGTESEPLREVKPWMDLLIEEMETNELRRYETARLAKRPIRPRRCFGRIHQCLDLEDQQDGARTGSNEPWLGRIIRFTTRNIRSTIPDWLNFSRS